MRRIKLVVSYDGTAYCGWQLQPNGVTIEEVLNKALSSLLKEDIQIIGASRTDSGVHAMGNVAVFDTESRIPGDKICFALNQRLPDDVRIQASEEVPVPDFPAVASQAAVSQAAVQPEPPVPQLQRPDLHGRLPSMPYRYPSAARFSPSPRRPRRRISRAVTAAHSAPTVPSPSHPASKMRPPL